MPFRNKNGAEAPKKIGSLRGDEGIKGRNTPLFTLYRALWYLPT
ncbi:hypothetical protein CSC17_5278 [Klebsiella oxytoca]|nr:hypothetical protein CSC17_5278 [Klebsiella oxytoca]